MTPDRAIWEWIDNAGGFLRSSNWVVPASSTGALEVALQNNSNAALQYATVAPPTVSATTPNGSQYHLVQDIAILVFATVPGTTLTVVVPGPLATTYGPSSNVVDPTDPNVAAIISAVIGVLSDSVGNPATAYVSGVKSSRRTEQT
jgi:hypothetical protein